ncbi:glucose-1-phosphate cytidylyltransferase [Rectinema subterraneum]|jgi:glucose-1-phosphate cytidylyltransferase|uniref:glucose-1-phosphate cytidylyltransferase n=1 Tax=Rectinema subterraneum TaxID=2653714 RepID=UPI00131CB5C3|nr:glucose-1-phosphate cytidylyltransferase [Rectinema subterraneum]
MKVVILAGGYGTRISEESDLKPKPMIEIGGKPILWHIMKIYSHYGFNDFIICCGYKGYVIKDYFHHYYMHQTDITIDLEKNLVQFHASNSEPWRVTLVDTGLNTMTGGRIKRIQSFVGNESFMLTYGDGVSDIDILSLLDFHKKNKRLATLTAVQPSGKFGALGIDNQNAVIQFQEKPKGDGAWINGGFFVCEPGIFDYIRSGDETIWERQPLEDLSRDGQLRAYKHEGFWQPMDTLRDKNELERLWSSGKAPWKVWE